MKSPEELRQSDLERNGDPAAELRRGDELELYSALEAEALPPRRPSFVRRLFSRPTAVFAVVVLTLFIAMAVFAPLLAPFEPNRQDLTNLFQTPSSDHLLGTDNTGRDVLSRVIHGARISLFAGLLAVSIGVGGGVPLGLLAGYKRGVVDTVLGRLNDMAMSVPGLVLALSVIAVLGPGVVNAMIAIGLILIPVFFRITRAATLDVGQSTFIEASVTVGCSSTRVMWAHVLPNVLPPLMVQASLALGTAIMAEAALSFLGLGVRPPAPSWGGMLASASQRLEYSYLLWGPGVALVLTVLAFTLLGDALRDTISGSDQP